MAVLERFILVKMKMLRMTLVIIGLEKFMWMRIMMLLVRIWCG